MKEKLAKLATLDNLKKINTIVGICSFIGTAGAFLLDGPISDREKMSEIEKIKEEVINELRKES